MKKYLWDTGALSLFFAENKKVIALHSETIGKNALGYVPTIVLSEFYYKTWGKFGQQAAEVRTISIAEEIKEIGITSDDKFSIGELKIKNMQLSIVDAIVLTLGKKYESTILTTDITISKVKGYSTIKLDY